MYCISYFFIYLQEIIHMLKVVHDFSFQTAMAEIFLQVEESATIRHTPSVEEGVHGVLYDITHKNVFSSWFVIYKLH